MKMRILDINNNVISKEDYVEEMGRLIEEKLLIAHHPAQEYIEEQGHYEVITEYANGGKDVEWVVDVPGQQACEAWDEYEDILRIIPWTDAEKAMMEIDELKNQLDLTDYNILKVVEGAATLVEVAEVVAKRATWRKRINELEAQYNL